MTATSYKAPCGDRVCSGMCDICQSIDAQGDSESSALEAQMSLLVGLQISGHGVDGDGIPYLRAFTAGNPLARYKLSIECDIDRSGPGWVHLEADDRDVESDGGH